MGLGRRRPPQGGTVPLLSDTLVSRQLAWAMSPLPPATHEAQQSPAKMYEQPRSEPCGNRLSKSQRQILLISEGGSVSYTMVPGYHCL